MSKINIPPEAVEAAARAAHDLWRKQASIGDDIAEYEQWDDLSRFDKDDLRAQATAALRAALAAWPGMQRYTFPPSGSGDDYCPAIDEIILPLTTENPDAEA